MNPASTAERYVLEDKGGSRLVFAHDGLLGRLAKIQDAQGNTLTVTTGTNAQVTQVTDGAGRVTDFLYTNGQLTEIRDPAGRSTRYFYTDSRLTQITYPDGQSSLYTYDPVTAYLKTVRTVDGSGLDLSYAGIGRTARITERGTNGAEGQSLTFGYTLNNTKVTDASGRSQTWQFDQTGKTLSVRDPDGSALFFQYGQTGVNADRLTLSSRLQRTVTNRLKNPGLEDSRAWRTDLEGGASGSTAAVSSPVHLGRSARQLTKATLPGLVQLAQTVSLEAGQTYTFSAWLKRQTVMPAADGGAFLRVRFQDGSGVWQEAWSPVLTGSADWERAEVSFTVPAGTLPATVHLSAGIRGTTGTLWIDSLQLETGPLANRFNLIENGDFSDSAAGWVSWTDPIPGNRVLATADPTHPQALSGSVYTMDGDSRVNQALYQRVAVSGQPGDRLVFDGWGQAQTLTLKNYRSNFGICVGINNTDGTTQWMNIRFNDDTREWQYAAQGVTAQKAYESVDLFLMYYQNLNRASFDGIGLYREAFGSQAVYDSQGNLTLATDPVGSATAYTYNAAQDLTGITEPDGQAVTLDYDTEHQPLQITTAEGETANFTYDDHGNILSTRIGTAPFLLTGHTYTADGNYLAAQTDERGYTTVFGHNPATGTLDTLRDANGQVTAYTYDPHTDRLLGVSRTVDAQTAQVGYGYTHDALTSVQHNGFAYRFIQDAFGRPAGISIGTQSLISYQYDSRGNPADTQYGNGQKTRAIYDTQDQLTAWQVWNPATARYETQYTYEADASGSLGLHQDLVNQVSYRYRYDAAGRPVSQTGTDGSGLMLAYDGSGRTAASEERLGSRLHRQTYAYGSDGRLSRLEAEGSAWIYTTDSLGRLAQVTRTTGAVSSATSYTYVPGAGGSATRLVETVTQDGQVSRYTYDPLGNIRTLTAGGQTITYAYNELSELVREDNPVLGQTWTYRYDTGGNLLEKKQYLYTAGTLGTPVRTIPYAYGNSQWKDQLTAYDGKAITYDGSGNPLTYDGWTYTWQAGRELQALTKGTASLYFAYNAQGLRTRKTVNGVTTRYTWFGDRLAFQTTGSDTIHYNYDENGRPLALSWNGAVYSFTTNLQGDVTGLRDAAGALVVSYRYDAWGKLLSATGSLAPTLGAQNGLRYRGYLYDTETGLYYLRSRYYDPVIGRWISPEPRVDIGEFDEGSEILGYNVYAYCFNNPVNHFDPDGEAVANIVGGVIGGVAGAALGVLLAQHLGLTGWKKWALISAATVGGAALGAFLGPYITKLGAQIGAKLGIKAIPKIGSQVGSLGKLVNNTKPLIKGFTKHGLERMAQRGVSQSLAQSIVKGGYAIAQSGGKTLFFTQAGAVVLNKAGEVVTAYSSKFFDAAMQEIIKQFYR